MTRPIYSARDRRGAPPTTALAVKPRTPPPTTAPAELREVTPVGSGPYVVEANPGGLYSIRHDQTGLKFDGGPYMAKKTAMRKARDLNAEAAGAIMPQGFVGCVQTTPYVIAEITVPADLILDESSIIKEVPPHLERLAERELPEQAGDGSDEEPQRQGVEEDAPETKEELAKRLIAEVVVEAREAEIIQALAEEQAENATVELTFVSGTSAARARWLNEAAIFAAHWLNEHGTVVPANVRVSLGLMKSKKAIGECWSDEASADGNREIFVSPTLDDGATIVNVLVHEMIHASLPFYTDEAKIEKTGHGPAFGRRARAADLEGKLTATSAGEKLTAAISEFLEQAGEYPGKALDPKLSGRPKQGTRMLKAECPTCGYVIRTTAKWVEKGLPICGIDDTPLELS